MTTLTDFRKRLYEAPAAQELLQTRIPGGSDDETLGFSSGSILVQANGTVWRCAVADAENAFWTSLIRPVNGTASDAAGAASLGWFTRVLHDDGGLTSVDWMNRYLHNGTNVIVDWGSQILWTASESMSLNWGDRTLRGQNDNHIVLDWDNGQIFHGPGSVSVDWKGFSLHDQSTITSLIWSTRQMYDNTSAQSINWQDRFLLDNQGNIAVDWSFRGAPASDGSDSLNWELRSLLASDGHSINWQARSLTETGGVHTAIDWGSGYINAAGLPAIYWPGRTLVNEDGNDCLSWSQRTLIGAFGQLALDWNNRQCVSASGTVTLDWAARQIYASDSTPLLDWTGPALLMLAEEFQSNGGVMYGFSQVYTDQGYRGGTPAAPTAALFPSGIINSVAAPANSAAPGTSREIRWDDDFIYVRTSTGAWKRAALTAY